MGLNEVLAAVGHSATPAFFAIVFSGIVSMLVSQSYPELPTSYVALGGVTATIVLGLVNMLIPQSGSNPPQKEAEGNDEVTEVLPEELASSLQKDKNAKYNPVTDNWFSELFFRKKFGTHRIVGLAFLIQFVYACGLYVLDYQAFRHSEVLWTLPITGILQSVTAIYTFTFLPKVDEPGYIAMGDKGVLSYNFIKENSFFEMILAFQWLYYSDYFHPLFKLAPPIECLFVFFPYYIRPLWPTTRFRTALKNTAKNKTEGNLNFMKISTYVVKVFYLFAKHYIGFFLNYLRFMGRVEGDTQRLVHGVLLTSCYATTIAIFIHTLKFKRYIGPRTATISYEISYTVVAYFYYHMIPVIGANLDLALLCALGIVINVASLRGWHVYQFLVFAFLFGKTHGYLPGHSVLDTVGSMGAAQ